MRDHDDTPLAASGPGVHGQAAVFYEDTRPAALPDLQARVAAIYDEHGAGLFRYAFMILANREAAEDAVQQAFTHVLARRHDAAVLESPLAYLRIAVRNECYTLLRRKRREPEGGAGDTLELLEAAGEGVPDEGERRALEQALRELPPEQREVLYLKVYEGWTFRELSAASGEPLNTVASRYRYGLDKLRARLARAGHVR